MKRVIPDDIYLDLPCSVVAVGTALGETDPAAVQHLLNEALNGVNGAPLHADGYLSLAGLNGLIRAKLSVRKREDFKRGERPALRDFAHAHLGQKAVVCVLGHYLYFDGQDYHSFFWNGGDEVIAVWYLD